MHLKAIGAILLVVMGSAVGLSTSRVQGQSASPSVRAAARLKYNPPRDWIRHYLPDDRYKLKGGAWKVVSTETDTFYYPAWAPEMLRQPAGIVIGFPSAAAAEEAGYKRSKYPMESPLLGLTGRPQPTAAAPPTAPPAATVQTPFGAIPIPAQGQGSANKGAARRIVLADGASSAILPPGWTHIRQEQTVPSRTGPQRVRVSAFLPGRADESSLRDPSRQRLVVFAFADLPPGMDASRLFNARTIRQARSGGAGGQIDTRAARVTDSMRPVRFGNITGVSMNVPVPQLGNVPLVMGGVGSKLVVMIDTSRNARGSRQIISSFRGR
jgi:hypothetical protein